ncbi:MULTISPECIES: SIMPL domain-containing protein [unclassified Sinorhizobium]|uniref:SIMPL domain-containing protein n=1 Tax=unclassified Sinorhizobium TaxID=2613772 RepID=UPI0024C241A3|nr:MULTISPECIES: SIMPL domain-containing protein [unclassified Sinorhizobium]MDK1375006.1 SIMPL domain-containing protein [Sinorhizobium sp. 6-70]MDK1482802.1 SIMPL domain-containing protein [Sinorhizobium sp. 6-117]
MISTRIARTVHVAAMAAAFAGAFAAAAVADESNANKGASNARPEGVRGRQALIKVSGEGRATAAPDMAIVQLSVVKDAKTAREALDANNKAMAEVLSALKQGGIAERDLQTSGFAINPQYNFPQGNDGTNRPPELIGYQVVNGVTVRVRDLSTLGEVLDKSVTLGINQGGGIEFTKDKPDEVITEARKAAVADAIVKAKVLAEAAGVSLGRLIEISEQASRPEPVPMVRSMAKEFAADAVPIATGENAYNVTVNVTFAIEQ